MRSLDAESVGATDRNWPPCNSSIGVSTKPNDRKFRSRHAASAASCSYSLSSDETNRANSISRVMTVHRDGWRSRFSVGMIAVDATSMTTSVPSRAPRTVTCSSHLVLLA